VAFTDVKINGKDKLQYYEEILYQELAYKIAPVFLVYINRNATQFEVRSYPDDTLIGTYNSREQYFQEFIERLGTPPLDEPSGIPPKTQLGVFFGDDNP